MTEIPTFFRISAALPEPAVSTRIDLAALFQTPSPFPRSIMEPFTCPKPSVILLSNGCTPGA